MKLTKYLIAAIAVLTVCSVRADEGMWLLQLMKQQNSTDMMKKQGLKLEADDLYNPNGVSLKDAVGIFGGGCTGEIISPEGLILTNHHCGYGAIQQHSSVEHDYLTDGFWAKSRNEELPTPGLKFRFVHRIVDITDLVNEKIKSGEVTEVNALTAPFLSKLAKEELEKSDLKGKPGIEVKALPFYAGNKFYLFYYKVYSDVRMVAAPPSSVGKFGGETRHTEVAAVKPTTGCGRAIRAISPCSVSMPTRMESLPNTPKTTCLCKLLNSCRFPSKDCKRMTTP